GAAAAVHPQRLRPTRSVRGVHPPPAAPAPPRGTAPTAARSRPGAASQLAGAGGGRGEEVDLLQLGSDQVLQTQRSDRSERGVRIHREEEVQGAAGDVEPGEIVGAKRAVTPDRKDPSNVADTESRDPQQLLLSGDIHVEQKEMAVAKRPVGLRVQP